MAVVNITEAARLVGVSEKTIRRRILSGELSAQVAGHAGQGKRLIDTSELIRVFGSMPGQVSAPVLGQSPDVAEQAPVIAGHADHPLAQVIEAQKVTIRTLETQLDARTQEARELRGQVVGLLEWRKPDMTGPVQAAPVAKVRRLYLLIAALVGAAFVCTLFWLAGYRFWFMLDADQQLQQEPTVSRMKMAAARHVRPVSGMFCHRPADDYRL